MDPLATLRSRLSTTGRPGAAANAYKLGGNEVGGEAITSSEPLAHLRRRIQLVYFAFGFEAIDDAMTAAH